VLGKAPQTFRVGPEFDPNNGLEGIRPEDEAEVARQVEELLGPSDGRPRQEPRGRARKTGGV